jgi:hypothetical protein
MQSQDGQSPLDVAYDDKLRKLLELAIEKSRILRDAN